MARFNYTRQIGLDDPEGSGWFKSRQIKGWRSLEEQLKGLKWVLERAPGRTILDIGSAEGVISGELIKRGAVSADCVELSESRCVLGRKLYPKIRFIARDVQMLDVEHDDLADSYDMVLLLSILQKIPYPEDLLEYAQKVARHYIAIRLPKPIMSDHRQKYRKIDVVKILKENGWVHKTKQGPRDEWVGLFRRPDSP